MDCSNLGYCSWCVGGYQEKILGLGLNIWRNFFLRHEEGEKGVKLKAVNLAEIKRIKDKIKTEVEEAIVKYQEESFTLPWTYLAKINLQAHCTTHLHVERKKFNH